MPQSGRRPQHQKPTWRRTFPMSALGHEPTSIAGPRRTLTGLVHQDADPKGLPSVKINYSVALWSQQRARSMSPDRPAQATCPKCRDALIYVTALPHPKAVNMRRTTFVCRPCNRTWVYSLSPEMADAYASIAPKPMPHDVEPVADSR